MRLQFPLLILGGILCGIAAMAAKPETLAEVKLLERKLDDIIIPKFEVREASLHEAVDTLLREAKRVSPKGLGLHVTLQLASLSAGTGEVPPPMPRIPGVSEPTAAPNPKVSGLTISLTKVSLINAVRQITDLAYLKYWVESDGVRIAPHGTPDPMFTHEFKIIQGPGISGYREPELMAAFKKDPRAFLTSQRVTFQPVTFPEGSSVSLNETATRLTVHHTRSVIETIESILEIQINPLPVPGPNVPKVQGGEEADQLRKKMRSIILPKVAIENTSLRGAIDHLNALAKRHDTRSTPGRRGVNIVLQRPDTVPSSVPGAESAKPLDETPDPSGGIEVEPKVSYSAKNVSLYDAVMAVALRGNYHVYVQSYAVALLPQPPNYRFVREYLVPPGLIPSKPPENEGPAGEKDSKAVNNWARPAADENTALFVFRTRKIIARGDDAFHRELWSKVDEGWQKYYASQKRQ